MIDSFILGRCHMGSIAMHLNISKKIQERNNYSDDFLVGAVLPDIYKRTDLNRQDSHYLSPFGESPSSALLLPDLDKYVRDNLSSFDSDITKGYFAHLVQDYIWFRYYSSKFAKIVGKDDNSHELYTYSIENHTKKHTLSEYHSQIYQDYSYWNKALLAQIDVQAVKNGLKEFLNNPDCNAIIEQEFSYHGPAYDYVPFFIPEETLNRYTRACILSFESEMKKIEMSHNISKKH